MTTGANNFKPFAVGGSANAITQSAYEALTTLIANGFLDGVADAAKVNKVLRQAAFGSAVLGEIIAANGVDALDDGDLAGFKTKLLAALNAALSITVPDASTTVKGKVELATPTETISGLDSERAVVPSGLAAAIAADPHRVKAWVCWDGTLSGTITPKANLNVASITKNGTGDFTLNITSGVLANANYALAGICPDFTSNAKVGYYSTDNTGSGIVKTTTAVRVRSAFGNNGYDCTDTAVIITGN